MKVAVVTNNGEKISAHFGRALQYLVVTVEEGKIAARELREKASHHGAHQHHGEEHGSGPHGLSPEHVRLHSDMIEPIRDCDVLLARGMGQGAYEHIRAAGIRPVITDIADVDRAVAAYVDGTLVDHTERLH